MISLFGHIIYYLPCKKDAIELLLINKEYNQKLKKKIYGMFLEDN
jgi:hypothetical protein